MEEEEINNLTASNKKLQSILFLVHQTCSSLQLFFHLAVFPLYAVMVDLCA